ncbi:MAG: Ldh family oxidoreductase [Planctomycetia bacterium]
MPTFAPDVLQRIAESLLLGMGASADEAFIVADHLVSSNLAGHDSHGVIRLPQYAQHAKDGQIKLGQAVEILRETPTTALMCGKYTWGQVVATKAMDLAVEKARANGCAAVAVRECYHVGRVGVYPLRAAEQGLIAKVWCNGHGVVRVAPWGGTEPRLATNPIAIAIPTGGRPVLVDITTSVVAEGKVRLAKNKGVSVPDGWLLDKNGLPTNDPADLYTGGSLLPFGGAVGHKGFGLSLVVDLLGGAATGDGCGAMPGVAVGNGLLIEVVDPTCFQTRDEYLRSVDEFLAYVRGSKPKPGVSEILLPGEPEFRTEDERRKTGVSVDDGTWGQLQKLAGQLGVTLPA